MDAGGPFQVVPVPGVSQEIRRLAGRAQQVQMVAEFYAALHTIRDRLTHEPRTWGDPEYRLQHPPGIARHAICDPLFLNFAVYDDLPVVFWLRVGVLSRYPLADQT
jgi:hypothetical protein